MHCGSNAFHRDFLQLKMHQKQISQETFFPKQNYFHKTLKLGVIYLKKKNLCCILKFFK